MYMEEKKITAAAPSMSAYLTEFNRNYKEVNELYHDTALHLELSDSAFDILYHLCENGDGCQQKDICAATCIPKQTIHSSIRNLEQSGYLTLARGRGRGMLISLTDAGRELVQKTIFPVIQRENEAFACMTPEECRQMLALQAKYTKALRTSLSALFQTELPAHATNTDMKGISL